MALDPVTSESAAVLQPAPNQAAPKNAAAGTGQDAGKGTQVPGEQVVLSGDPANSYQELQQKYELSNAAAGSIRNTVRSLESLSQKIDALKAPLETIIKNFPPTRRRIRPG